MRKIQTTVLLVILGSLVLAASARAHTFSPVAVDRAVAFWQPYSSTPVCPDGVVLHQVWQYGTPESVPDAAYTRRVNGIVEPNCNVYVAPQFRLRNSPMSIPMQCAFVARALGAAWFGLPMGTDRRNIMYGDAWVVPRACGVS